MAVSNRAEVEKLIGKDRLKEAVKAAKLCFKENGTPENHRLLERAYFLRARQLLSLGMPDSAIEVAGHLLEFGLTSDEWTEELVRLLMNLGLADKAFSIQAQSGRPELLDQLQLLAADQAVIHPERIEDTSTELAREARLVLLALGKIHAGDDEAALEMLRELPRSSLLSEWKFFVRGLIAHYQGDTEACSANWDRLDHKRKARQIAQRLREPGRTSDRAANSANLPNLEKLAFGEPVLARLVELQGLVAEHEWTKAMQLLAGLRQSLARTDCRLAERLTRILMAPVINAVSDMGPSAGEALLDRFTRAAQPVAIDPKWSRFWANGPNRAGADDEVIREHWMAYTVDLETSSALSSAERPLAKAMVWNAVATMCIEETKELDDYPEMTERFARFFSEAEDSESAAILKKEAVECLERSLKLAPDYLPTYQLLFEAHRHWDDQAAVEATALRLIEKFPDDLETLTFLVNSCIEKDKLDDALPYVRRARAQKPLDESLREREATIHIGLARHCALEGRWDEGRDQFRAALELAPDRRGDYTFLARRTVFEAKARERDLSDQFLKEAQAALEEPTPLWLVLAIEAIRYQMTPATRKGYADLWTADLKKKCRSQTAGEMAAVLDSFVSLGVKYQGREGHIKQAVAYLKRTTRLKYRQRDIERVCEFLASLPEQSDSLGKLLQIGLRQHPESVLLNFQAGMQAVASSQPPFIHPDARRHLEIARSQAEASKSAAESAMLPAIKDLLTMINELSSHRAGLPFGDRGFPFPGGPSDFFDVFMDDDDDFFDDESEHAPRGWPRTRPGPAKKRK